MQSKYRRSIALMRNEWRRTEALAAMQNDKLRRLVDADEIPREASGKARMFVSEL